MVTAGEQAKAGVVPDAPVVALGPARVGEVAAVVARALPAEHLTADELLAVCWDDPDPAGPGDPAGTVLAVEDASGRPVGVAAAVARSLGEPPDELRLAWLKLIAVDPDHRRAGLGHRLLGAVESWAWAQGAAELHVAGSPPFYLWPGVDALATGALCLLEARGYRELGGDVNMALRTDFRADPPPGVVVRRVVEDADVARLEALVGAVWPEWLDEARRAVDHGCCHLAVTGGDDGEVAVGFVCHSVSRAGWLGPMGTDPARQQGGVGSALLAAACEDLRIAELPTTEICWVGPARFYAKNGAVVSRAFRRYRRRRPRPAGGGVSPPA